MRTRYDTFKEAGVRSLSEFNTQATENNVIPWWIIVLDEYADLTLSDEDRKAVEEPLVRIAQKARAAGIHVVVATQRPSAEVIRPVIRSNLPAQLALRVRSAVDSRIIIDQSGAEALAGKGDCLVRTTRGIQRVQCGMLN
jgi:DNA phosphorothioation-dependent restriction protein DptH